MDRLLNSRGFAIIAIILSSLVLLLSVCGIVGTWVANSVASNLVVDVSVGVEKSAQALERAVLRLDTAVENLRGEIGEVEQAVAQISATVADEGIIRQLLPETVETRIDNTMARINETTSAISDSVSALRDLYQSINRIPFVSLPSLDTEATQTITTNVAELRADVQEFRETVTNVRQRQANAIGRIGLVAERVDTRLARTQDNLNRTSAMLTSVQNAAVTTRRTLPTVFTIGSALGTLLFLWVIVSQVLVIRNYWGKLRGKESEAMPSPAPVVTPAPATQSAAPTVVPAQPPPMEPAPRVEPPIQQFPPAQQAPPASGLTEAGQTPPPSEPKPPAA